jgi:hypothetical protein
MIRLTASATSEAELHRAAELLAQVITIIGVVALMTLITKAGRKLSGKAKGAEVAPKEANAIGAGDVDRAIGRLEERGLKFGQHHIFLEGNEGRSGVAEYVKRINDPNAECALPWIDKNGVLMDGHHMAVAMEITGSWSDDLVLAAKENTAALARKGELAGWKYVREGIPRADVSIMDRNMNIVAGKGAETSAATWSW